MEGECRIKSGPQRYRKSANWISSSQTQKQHADGNGRDHCVDQKHHQEILWTERIKQTSEEEWICGLFDSSSSCPFQDRILKLRRLQDPLVEEPVPVFIANRVALTSDYIQSDLNIIIILTCIIASEGDA